MRGTVGGGDGDDGTISGKSTAGRGAGEGAGDGTTESAGEGVGEACDPGRGTESGSGDTRCSVIRGVAGLESRPTRDPGLDRRLVDGCGGVGGSTGMKRPFCKRVPSSGLM